MSKTCWLRTASPLPLPKNESFESCLLESFSAENLCLLSHTFLPTNASWMPVPLFKWHLPKEEFSKTEQHSFIVNISHRVLNLKQESGSIIMLFIFFTGSAKAQMCMRAHIHIHTHTPHTHMHVQACIHNLKILKVTKYDTLIQIR